MAFSFGREHENLGPTLGILRSKTWSVSFSAKHWMTNKFGLSVDGTIHRQGDIYYRRGLTFGIRYRF
jgi:YaiO family outer membrane protein